MNLEMQYDEAIKRGEINNDPIQRDFLTHLQRIIDELESKPSWFSWRKQQIKGLYVYGPVGAGKTYLIDMFYQCVTEKKKARFHFHHFMQQVDVQLRQLQGKEDPLRQLAKNIAQSTRLLCFDEFLIHDVAYAMILAELLQALHAEGVILVISSNTKPDDLYANGVQRQRFLPAIALIKNNCDVFFLNEQRDYRRGRQPLLNAYLYPLNQQTADVMQQQFIELSKEIVHAGTILIQNREIPYIQKSEKSLWFAFSILCNLPRSQLDYLEIADLYDNVFLSDIPCLTENHTTQTIMFIHFIDVMYDRGINVIISAAVPLDKLYVSGELKDTFLRTQSRLAEMQSVDYLQRHPRRQVENIH